MKHSDDTSTATPRLALGASPASRRVTVDGVELAFDDVGHGPPLVCLHAVGHGASDFSAVLERFAPSHRVIALDWPDHGRSGADRFPPTARRYAELLAGFLTAIGAEAPILLGNSIGGAAAIRHAARAAGAERCSVRALILENPGGLAPVDDRLASSALAGMVRFFAAGERGAWWFPRAFAAYYRLVLPRRHAAAQRRRIVAAGPSSAGVLRQAWEGFANPDADLRSLVRRVRCPVLFAWATRDRFVTLARSLPAIRAFSAARLVELPAGHSPHLELPGEFEELLTEFLRELKTGEPGVDLAAASA